MLRNTHSCFRNWTASNDDSGKKLAAYIEEVIQLYKCQGRICDQVILITHSMGGLVARSACIPLGTVASWVLGTDGEEVTALLGNMPGGLELLPNQNYTDNTGGRAWLKFPVADGLSRVELPNSDPY